LVACPASFCNWESLLATMLISSTRGIRFPNKAGCTLLAQSAQFQKGIRGHFFYLSRDKDATCPKKTLRWMDSVARSFLVLAVRRSKRRGWAVLFSGGWILLYSRGRLGRLPRFRTHPLCGFQNFGWRWCEESPAVGSPPSKTSRSSCHFTAPPSLDSPLEPEFPPSRCIVCPELGPRLREKPVDFDSCCDSNFGLNH